MFVLQHNVLRTDRSVFPENREGVPGRGKYVKLCKTRMHSSRMRTTRRFTIFGGVGLPPGRGKYLKLCETSMHSCTMRTARVSSHLTGECTPPTGQTPPGRHLLNRHPCYTPVARQTRVKTLPFRLCSR